MVVLVAILFGETQNIGCFEVWRHRCISGETERLHAQRATYTKQTVDVQRGGDLVCRDVLKLSLYSPTMKPRYLKLSRGKMSVLLILHNDIIHLLTAVLTLTKNLIKRVKANRRLAS
jgi:hypothetical protein